MPTAVVLAVAAAAAWSARDAVLPATAVRVTPVVLRPVAAVASGAGGSASAASSGGVVAQAAGWVEPDPYPVAISALTDGIVRDVLVLEGQRVAVGEVVARLIDEDAKLGVQKADADLAAATAEFVAAERQWDNPVEQRRAVATAKASLEESRAELAKIDADVVTEQARADEMADLAGRLEKLVAVRASAEQELVGLRFRLKAQQAVIKTTEARRPVLEALIRQKEAEVVAAEQNATLRIADARAVEAAKASVMQAEAMLDQAKLRLARTDVRAPAAGVVMSLLAEPGGKLMLAMDAPHSAYVARLYDPAKLQVRVDVPLADAPKVGVGTRAEITAEALPGRTLSGEVTRVVNEADLTKNTLQFKVRIHQPPEGLKPEMLARVKFIAGEAKATSQPSSAGGGAHLPFVPSRLVAQGASPSVLVADVGRGVAVRRPVTLAGHEQAGWVAIANGVSAGDRVISEPTTLADGARIRVVGEDEEETPQANRKAGSGHGVH